MNDMSELQYARDVIVNCISSRLQDPFLTDIQKDFLSRASRGFRDFDFGAAVYSVSFCEGRNLLSQWRAYRGQGGGYALGFDFFHAIRLLNRRCVLRKIIYDIGEQKRIVDLAIGGFIEFIGAETKGMVLESVDPKFMNDTFQVFLSLTDELIFCLKHPDFHEEKEWRLVYFSQQASAFNREVPTPQFRDFQGNVIPYYSVGFEAAISASNNDLSGIGFPIREIVIGPTINAGLNRQSLKSMIFGLAKDIEPCITSSEIPVRWL